MFESDDFDQVLSQFEFPEIVSKENEKKQSECQFRDGPVAAPFQPRDENRHSSSSSTSPKIKYENTLQNSSAITMNSIENQPIKDLPSSVNVSPKHVKRKLIDSHFNPKSKRKFPGPAGLLSGTFVEAKDETICDMELFSQDVDFSQNNLRRDLFESPLWNRLLEDVKSWNLSKTDSIKEIKQQAVAGNLQRKKAKTVTAFVERVDRSVIDPLIILRDASGSIKCTLHRDAWSIFSSYLASENCFLVLLRPTVLTTGSAFKKHYLNITLSNIYAIYSSVILEDEEKELPDDYIKATEETFTIIRSKTPPNNYSDNTIQDPENDANMLLDGLDASIFSEDYF